MVFRCESEFSSFRFLTTGPSFLEPTCAASDLTAFTGVGGFVLRAVAQYFVPKWAVISCRRLAEFPDATTAGFQVLRATQ